MPPKPYITPRFYPPVPVGDPTVKVRPLAGYRQVREYTCGFAATLMVLHAYHRRAEPRAVYESLGTNYTGTSQSSIIRELRQHNLSVSLKYNFDFDALRTAIDGGKLVIAYHHRLEHWVVAYGYGREPQRVFVADPYWGTRSEHLWSHYGEKMRGFGMVCSPRRARTNPGRMSARRAQGTPPQGVATLDVAS